MCSLGGCPLVEGFANVTANDDDCFTNNKGEKYCRVIDDIIESEQPVEEDGQAEYEEQHYKYGEEDEHAEGEQTTMVVDQQGEQTTMVVDQQNDEEEYKEKYDQRPGGEEEEFTGNNVIEGFAGSNITMRKLMNVNLILKSILFGCLFYILAHPQSRSFMVKNLFKGLKKSQYLYVAMVLFIVIYYVLNLVV